MVPRAERRRGRVYFSSVQQALPPPPPLVSYSGHSHHSQSQSVVGSMWRCSVVRRWCRTVNMIVVTVLVVLTMGLRVHAAVGGSTKCYDDAGRPQRCIPEFENAAFNVRVEATNTCGEGEYGPILYCLQSGGTGNKSCEFCRNDVPHLRHPSDHLTDLNNYENQTWWQSETMYEDIQYPNQVNLTLHLGKAFDITYVRLVFYSPKPESFAIYKRTSEDGPWIPYQYYSATCRDTYGLTDDSYVSRREESRAICTSEFSDISPLTGGNVAFSTLEGRPSAKNFDSSPELQDWVTATDIRITLDRLNTFGDEVFGDPQVLRSYFYAISEFAVGARCKCNGHASECVTSSALDGSTRRVCRCEHNTAGPDCNECLPFYNDVPWARSSATNVHECKACNCNGFSNRCFFDLELYTRTGHGGHCLDCTGNRDGANCERCKENFFQREEDGYCIACGCNEIGSRSLQCNSEGRCQCKAGVTGDKCDRCDTNFYDFGPQGCKPCGCSEEGSFANSPRCDPYTGTCYCKLHVEGKRCDRCKPSFFNLDLENDFGCTPCFCYGHSSVCQSAPGYSQVVIENNFARGAERWTAQEANGRSISMNFNGITQAIGVSAPGRDPVYFVAPDRYLGDMRASYNRDLQFKLRLGESAPAPSVEDVVLEGAGIRITQTIFGQRNPLPAISSQEYKFRLHEDTDYGWQPRLTAREFMSVLSNLTALKIRGTYTPEGVGFIDDVQLHTARREAAGRPANWIEMCTCPDGYVGQFCESCAPGFRHEPAHGGRFARCVPCNCNGHADICDADTGRCICQHNTAGENCDRCARGFYGNALAGTSSDCQPCPCPNQGACVELMDETVVCLECPKGYGGPRCDICSDGFFGDPEGRFGRVVDCEPCDCNTNVDPNGIGNCNRTTGECLKCIYNTGGAHCDQCLPGFFGDALAIPKGDCKPCQCYRPGTQVIEGGPMACDQLTGQCRCKPYVTGTNCDTCEDGFFNIVSGEGCQPCNCDPIGSINGTCNIVTGQCQCRPGVTGLRCDVCEQYKFGFSSTGCKSCDCDPIGSVELQCDPFGQCPCYDNVEGQRCDQCKENKFDRQRGCIDCPACYNLVQDAVNAHRKKLSKLVELLSNITDTPTVIDDVDFERKLNEVQERVDQLWTDAKSGAGSGDKTLLERLDDLKNRLQAVSDMHKQVHDMTGKARDSTGQGERNATLAEDAIERAQEALKNALEYLQTEGAEALAEAIRRSEQFGQQSDQMSDIARQARQLAQDQEDEATSIKNIAEQAVNTSQQAYEIAKNAINEQKNTSDELRTLRHDLDSATDRLDRTKLLAADARERAAAVHEEALGIYRDVYGLNVPELDTRKVRAESEKAAEDARRIKADAEALLAEHGELLSELAEQSAAVQDLLKRGVEQQQVADELLADADAANADAEEAVRLGDKTLAEAQNTLTTLQEFDKDVQASKDRAQEALERMAEITALIEEAEDKTARAREALAGAEQDAQIARDTAQEAQQQYAEQASQEADEIRQGADETKKLAEQVRDEADRLASRVADTGSRVKDLEDRAAADETLTTEAKQKVGQAKSNAAEATKKVEKALSEVDDILKELQDVTDIDEDQLNNLEKKLADAERDFQAANLDQRMDELKAMRLQQMQWMKDYTEEVARLRAEVNNIEDIRNSLPDGCWKRVKLEP